MITNPYDILGVSPGASNDEIKKAYRELSRKFHPDSHVDNPLSGLAEEKFKEVQEAYEQIMRERDNGTYGGGYTAGQANYTENTAEENTHLNAVANYLNARRYREALNVLGSIANRGARWYYYSAVANAGVGNNIMALDHARQAVNLEPNNREYVTFLNQLEWQTQRYQGTRSSMGGGYGTGNLCCDLWCADSLCECMGGDLCSCM